MSRQIEKQPCNNDTDDPDPDDQRTRVDSSEKHETMPGLINARPPSLSPLPPSPPPPFPLPSLPPKEQKKRKRKEKRRKEKKKVDKRTSRKSVREDPSVPGEQPGIKRIAVPGWLMRMRRWMGPARRTAMGIGAVGWPVGRRAMMRLEGHREIGSLEMLGRCQIRGEG